MTINCLITFWYNNYKSCFTLCSQIIIIIMSLVANQHCTCNVHDIQRLMGVQWFVHIVVDLALTVPCTVDSYKPHLVMLKHVTTKVKCRSSGNSALWLAIMEEKIVHDSAVKFATTKSNGKPCGYMYTVHDMFRKVLPTVQLHVPCKVFEAHDAYRKQGYAYIYRLIFGGCFIDLNYRSC